MAGAIVIIAALVGLSALNDARRHHDPGGAFREITGRDLPAGVVATAYAHEVHDNLFHTGHYWLLSGEPGRIRAVIEGTGFVRSDEDARGVLPDVEELFGVSLSRAEVVEGYEWELPRDDWYFIFAGEHSALYEHN